MKRLSILLLYVLIASCGIYSLSGAKIEGKTIDLQLIENRAQNINPALSALLTEKLRSRIISQTSLNQSNNATPDYVLSGAINSYDVITGAVSSDVATKNRLNITVQIDFTNNLNPRASFKKTYAKFAEFNAEQTIQSVERDLIDRICSDIADAVFSDAFVNW